MSKLIDYTRRHWGHNLSIKTRDDGLLSGFCWSQGGVSVGDELLWHTSYGTARGRVVESRRTTNVDDMYEITVEVVDRAAS